MSSNPHTVPFNQPPPLPAQTDDISQQLSGICYPLSLSFKIMALTSQATVTDANGKTLLYTKQKMFRFREHVELFTDKSRSTHLADIRTKKIIDWSARYESTDAKGQAIGSVGRKGWRPAICSIRNISPHAPTVNLRCGFRNVPRFSKENLLSKNWQNQIPGKN